MSKAERRTRHNDLRTYNHESGRRDAGADVLTRMLGTGHPLFPDVCRELVQHQREGGELTADVVRRIVARVQERYAGQPLPIRPDVEPTRVVKAPPRFGHIPVGEEVVYYMRVGNRVKIGTTTNLRMRLASINPEELLAKEPGGYQLERSRHAQFKSLRTVGEWFKYEGALVDHIEKLKGAK